MTSDGSIDSYEDAVSVLDQHRDIERTRVDEGTPSFDLREMERAIDVLGHPERSVPLVHVAGTKGKGSVCYMLEAFVHGAGFTPGTFLSPHLHELRERLRVDRTAISRERFTDLLDELYGRLSDEGDDLDPSRLTYFEWLTLMAFVLFEQENVEAGVLETGMGGRLDSTNISVPDVCVITSIGLDHEAFLGDTVEEIAAEKAGIIKEGVPLVTTAEPGEGRDVILDQAEEKNAPVYALDRDFQVVDRIPQGGSGTGQKVVLELASGDRLDLHLSIPGRHQAKNLAASVQAAQLFIEQNGGLWNPGIVGSAARQLSMPARFQVQNRRPPLILDAAHNPLSCSALVEALAETNFSTPRTLLFGTASDKDWREMMRIMEPAFSRIILTGYDHPRAEDPERIRDWCAEELTDVDVDVETDSAAVVRTFLDREDKEGPLVVAGSFYLIGQLLEQPDLFPEESSETSGMDRS